ncbi:MAG: hypothetical protein IJ764_08350 [Bacteroidales bacterium]|nr:hypothetical protein [Bacteroidales bacterium]
MKKILFIVAFASLSIFANAQQVSSRAKALRIMSYARPEYMVKDVKIIADTMTVYTLSEQVIYPFGKWNTLEEYITNTELQWYREVGYRKFMNGMEVSVNTIKRLDGSFIDIYRSITTGKVEMLSAKITDPEIVFRNGLHVGMTMQEVYMVYFTKFLKSYVVDVNVLKIISGAGEVSQIYTFKGKKLRHLQVRSDYKFY